MDETIVGTAVLFAGEPALLLLCRFFCVNKACFILRYFCVLWGKYVSARTFFRKKAKKKELLSLAA